MFTALILASSLILSLIILSPTITLAATTTVTDCTQAGLQQAINNTAPPATLTFDATCTLISFSGSPITIDSTIAIDGANNISLYGVGNTHLFTVTNGGDLTLKNITLLNGTAQGDLGFQNGGAIKVNSGGSLTAIATTFFLNHANENGGAIYSQGTVNITDSEFSDNDARSTGGAIANFQGTLNINYTTFSGNDSVDGGAIDNYGPLEITHSTFTQNDAQINGGAIWNHSSAIKITQSDFATNRASYGGAIANDTDASIELSRSSLTRNTAVLTGGAILNAGTLNTTQSIFLLNSAPSGGAISLNGDSQNTQISQSTFINNSAAITGGAINIADGQSHITSTTFSLNEADASGSSVAIGPDTEAADISWSTIVQPENTTPALDIAHDLTLQGVLLAGDDQHCQIDGGTLNDSYTLANDASCNLSGNGSRQEITNLGLGVLTFSTINDIFQFHYPLLADSPAIDAGPTSCDTDILDDPDPDQLGNPRPYHYYCDIGAIESPFATTLLCVNTWNGALRLTGTNACNRSETLINIAHDAPLQLCVNNWNSTTRLATHCTRSEHPIIIAGDHTTSACANRWNGTLRLTQNCTRSETHHWL